jgi:AcrR family transcriptional regulator
MSDPGTHRPRTKPAAVRREELLDAAERLFLAHGVDATSIDEIVAAANVAKGTLYLYFASKEKLLQALADRYARSFRDTLAAAMAGKSPQDWPGRLDAWVGAAVDDQLDRVALHDIAFHANRLGDHQHGDSPVVEQLAEMLAAGSAAGAWSVTNPRLTAVMLFHAMHGAVDESVMEASGADRRGLADALRRFFRLAIGAP